MNLQKEYEDIANQVCEVYSEHSCCFNYRSDRFVSRKNAYAILKRAIPMGYNAFKADIILDLPDDVEVMIAREGSVCLYLKGDDLPSMEDLMADEYTVESNGITRVWWD